MNLKEKAKLFAIKAHIGQIRKSEPDKPMIMHPISVGNYLESLGCDEAVVAAGYLHDVVEDTSYTIEDIRKHFNDDIADLVMVASEPDKSLSWEERKLHTIQSTRLLPLRKKMVICADKIDNLEDIMLKIQKSGVRDFSAFKRGEEQQKWYYTSMYESLIYGEDENLPIFKKLKSIIEAVFGGYENSFLRDTIFAGNDLYYEELKKLHAQKLELQKLRSLSPLAKPFVIEFCGTPRTGKTTIINNLYDFLKKGNFNVQIIEEFTTSKYYRENLKNNFKETELSIRDIAIVEEVYKQLLEALKSGKEIILIDRSINDRQIWNYRRYLRGEMSEEQYLDLRERYSALSKELIDFLVITYADSLTALRRDYNSSLALENRSFLNIPNLDEYNQCLNDLEALFEGSVDCLAFIDTSNVDMADVSIDVSKKVMPEMRKKYIKSFKQQYKLN